MDIDQDDIPEIPVQGLFPGYQDTDSDLIRMTRWMTVTKDGTLQEEERGYYSLGGWLCIFAAAELADRSHRAERQSDGGSGILSLHG